jgi:hypothetical protein
MKIKTVLVFVLLSVWSPYMCYPKETVATVCQMLNGTDWHARERGIDAAVQFLNDKQVRLELIKLLERENKKSEDIDERHKNGSLPLGESPEPEDSNGEYYGELLSTVIKLKDPRAIKGLVSALGTGNGAVNAVADFGETAIDPLLDSFPNPPINRIQPDIIRTLGKIVKEKNVGVVHKDRVKTLFLEQVHENSDQEIKQNIVGSLDAFPDDDKVVKVLEDLSASDTYYVTRHVKGRPKTERVKIYPIKEEAQKTLGRVRAKRMSKYQQLQLGATQAIKAP